MRKILAAIVILAAISCFSPLLEVLHSTKVQIEPSHQCMYETLNSVNRLQVYSHHEVGNIFYFRTDMGLGEMYTDKFHGKWSVVSAHVVDKNKSVDAAKEEWDEFLMNLNLLVAERCVNEKKHNNKFHIDSAITVPRM